jgi:hypothetical protein
MTRRLFTSAPPHGARSIAGVLEPDHRAARTTWPDRCPQVGRAPLETALAKRESSPRCPFHYSETAWARAAWTTATRHLETSRRCAEPASSLPSLPSRDHLGCRFHGQPHVRTITRMGVSSNLSHRSPPAWAPHVRAPKAVGPHDTLGSATDKNLVGGLGAPTYRAYAESLSCLRGCPRLRTATSRTWVGQ